MLLLCLPPQNLSLEIGVRESSLVREECRDLSAHVEHARLSKTIMVLVTPITLGSGSWFSCICRQTEICTGQWECGWKFRQGVSGGHRGVLPYTLYRPMECRIPFSPRARYVRDILGSTGAANIPGLCLTWVRAVILNLESVTLQYSSCGGDPQA